MGAGSQYGGPLVERAGVLFDYRVPIEALLRQSSCVRGCAMINKRRWSPCSRRRGRAEAWIALKALVARSGQGIAGGLLEHFRSRVEGMNKKAAQRMGSDGITLSGGWTKRAALRHISSVLPHTWACERNLGSQSFHLDMRVKSLGRRIHVSFICQIFLANLKPCRGFAGRADQPTAKSADGPEAHTALSHSHSSN
jgi:hypothetical protein